MENLQKFSVIIEDGIEKYNEVLSKARCRIFYKGENRNGGYITDEFAASLVATLPYTPVKGIFSNESNDYTDHGAARDLGKIYGIVPGEPNLSWESNVDEDGVVREYATVDVLLFTTLYKEARDIVGKPQSMELYTPSIKGEWEFINGRRLFKYTEACFLGLQVLGDDTIPCFEGAAFFSLYEDFVAAVKRLEEFSLSQENNIGGNQNMINFSMSDSTKEMLIWNILNTKYNEEGGWLVEYGIVDVYDDYVIVKDYHHNVFLKIGYTKTDDSVTLGEDCVEVKIEFVTADEQKSLETLRKLNNNSLDVEPVFSERDALAAEKEELTEKISEFTQKLEESEAQIATLNTEKESLVSSHSELQSKFEALDQEKTDLAATVEELNAFKASVISKEKEELLEKYTSELSSEVIEGFKETLDNYTVKELEKELAFAYVESKPNLFATHSNGYVPKETPITGVEGLISKHKK